MVITYFEENVPNHLGGSRVEEHGRSPQSTKTVVPKIFGIGAPMRI